MYSTIIVMIILCNSLFPPRYIHTLMGGSRSETKQFILDFGSLAFNQVEAWHLQLGLPLPPPPRSSPGGSNGGALSGLRPHVIIHLDQDAVYLSTFQMIMR